MSPKSQLKGMRNVKMRRDSEVQKLRNYVADTELPLNNDQDEEMSQVVSTVEQMLRGTCHVV